MLGTKVFGGWITKESMIHINKVNFEVPTWYIPFNFNDYGSAYVTLFVLMIQNNWHLVTFMYTILDESLQVYLFFTCFYFMTVIVILNIVLAFIIDIYMSIEEQNKKGTEEIHKIEK